LRRFFDGFNRLFERATDGYVHWSGVLLKKTAVMAVLLVLFAWLPDSLPIVCRPAFFPMKTRAMPMCPFNSPMQPHWSERQAAVSDIEKTITNTPGVQYSTCFVGFSLLSFVRTTYNATFFVTFKPWDDRTTRAEQFQTLKANLNAKFSKIPEAVVFGFSPPAIPGVGTAGGFTFLLEDRSGSDVPVSCEEPQHVS
jgi:hydrophobic/amphiphilic exporter-1 (mainly G- bacteria), HAE1 family